MSFLIAYNGLAMCMCRLNHTLKLITRPYKALHIAVVRHLLKL